MKWDLEFDSSSDDKVKMNIVIEDEVTTLQGLRLMGLSAKGVMAGARQLAKELGLNETQMIAAMDGTLTEHPGAKPPPH